MKSFWIRYWWPIHLTCFAVTAIGAVGSWYACLWGSALSNAFMAGVMLNSMAYQPLLLKWRRIADESQEQTRQALGLLAMREPPEGQA